jgi:hypothetical protein
MSQISSEIQIHNIAIALNSHITDIREFPLESPGISRWRRIDRIPIAQEADAQETDDVELMRIQRSHVPMALPRPHQGDHRRVTHELEHGAGGGALAGRGAIGFSVALEKFWAVRQLDHQPPCGHISSRYAANELIRLCLLRWENETLARAFHHSLRHFTERLIEPSFFESAHNCFIEMYNSLAPKISRLLPGSPMEVHCVDRALQLPSMLFLGGHNLNFALLEAGMAAVYRDPACCSLRPGPVRGRRSRRAVRREGPVAPG